MVLRGGFIVLAQRLQEAADMAHSNVRRMLSDAVDAAHAGTGKYGSYMDHTGDGESGDCVYMSNGDYMSCPYSISDVGGKKSASIDTESAKKVTPVTSYEEMAGDDDHYTSMEESLKTGGFYTELPIYERFISKTERSAAGDEDFAGKGKSFPILKPEDVSAAVHAMGRAGDKNYGASGLKARIIAIAKRKGWTKYLPKTWQDSTTPATEANRGTEAPGLKISESTPWTADEAVALMESAGGVEREIKIIKPGAGSSAFYTESALRGSGPKVFTKGTQMFINHATRAEESERPEGDWHKLVGALTSDAVYHEAHKDGPGLYAKARFASGIAPEILEKAKLGAGLSIRANGKQALEAGRPVMKDGLPVLSEFTNCESVDIVTKAGAGGMILTEAARSAANSNEVSMTENEMKELREAAKIVRENTARTIATRTLADMSLMEAGKSRVIDTCVRMGVPMKDGVIDEAVFVESVKAEAKREGQYLASLLGTGVSGAGSAPAVELTGKEKKRALKEAKARQEADTSVFADLMGNAKAAKYAATGRAA